MVTKALMRHHRLAGLLLLGSLAACDSGETVVPPLPMEEEGVLLDVAGTQGVAGNGGDGGPAIACSLFWPVDVTITEHGDLLVVDWENNRIRKIGPDGIIRAFIGSGLDGDDTTGQGTSVDLDHPAGIAIAAGRDYVVPDFYNHRIKTFDLNALECSVLAGTGSRGFTGDGGPASLAKLDHPSSVVVDVVGNFFVLDLLATRIRKVDSQTGTITTVAGGTRGRADGVGQAAQFQWPGVNGLNDVRTAMDVSHDGEEIYLADTENHTVRRLAISSGWVTTIAGSYQPGWEGDGGAALSAKLNYPLDVAVASNGDIYVADTHNHVVRKISVLGIITTVAGTGVAGSSPSWTPAVEGMLYEPRGIEFDDATKTLYIADTYNHQVRKIINP